MFCCACSFLLIAKFETKVEDFTTGRRFMSYTFKLFGFTVNLAAFDLASNCYLNLILGA